MQERSSCSRIERNRGLIPPMKDIRWQQGTAVCGSHYARRSTNRSELNMKHYIPLLALPLFCINAANAQSHECMMQPSYFSMEIPINGFTWLNHEEFHGSCKQAPDTKWTRRSSKQFDLYVHAEGPEGSGRFWTITIGFSTKHEAKPTRGFCFQTSTVGWRTLQEFKQTPLLWVDDQDQDGRPELIIWESFQLHDEASTTDYGLVAWVYQVDRYGRCRIHLNLSRKVAAEIAAAYRKPLDERGGVWQDLRQRAAEALKDFASGKCTCPHQKLRSD